MVPPTPRQTPSPPPLNDDEPPSVSFITPPPAPPPAPLPAPLPAPKVYQTTSVQCEPEPVPPKPKPVTPPPAAPKTLKKSEPTVISMHDSGDLTSSTQYSSDVTSSSTSTTISESTSQNVDEEDSYFSDGAWLMSKSEGQIVQCDNNQTAFVNLDMASAVKSVILNPRPANNRRASEEGELKLDQISSDQMRAYGGKQAPGGVNKIHTWVIYLYKYAC